MAAVRTLNLSGVGTRRSRSIDKRIWGCEGTSASATVSRMMGKVRGLLLLPPSGGGLADGSKAISLERHFWARNAPYNDPTSLLKLQQMPAPSERTTPRAWR